MCRFFWNTMYTVYHLFLLPSELILVLMFLSYKLRIVSVNSSSWEFNTELGSTTCHMGSHSVTCHPAQVTAPPSYPQPGKCTWFSYPRWLGRMARLSWPWWLRWILCLQSVSVSFLCLVLAHKNFTLAYKWLNIISLQTWKTLNCSHLTLHCCVLLSLCICVD